MNSAGRLFRWEELLMSHPSKRSGNKLGEWPIV